MKRYTKTFFIAAVLLTFNNIVFGADRAVNISILSNGAGNVGPTIASVRQLVGHAVGSGIVDNFVVIAPKEGGPILIEGGLTSCAEAGFGIVKNDSQAGLPPGLPQIGVRNKFEALVKQLRSIKPDSGVSLNINLTESCGISIDPEDKFPACGGIAGLSCPDSLICIDDPSDNCDPKNGGADCIGICVTAPGKQ
jgi:hypothetical protein